MSNLKQVLAEIDLLKAKLDSLLPMKREDEERLWKKFRLEWNYNSNHIEGNTLTYGQTELLLIFDKTTGDHDMREYEEMKAHDVAIKKVVEYANDKSRDLAEADIRELNKLILVRPFWSDAITPDGQPTRKLIQPGEYKKQPNSVRLQNGEIFHYASPEETPAKMEQLIQWYRQASTDEKIHPVEVAARLHYDFVRIHPFDDSNGRTARLLMNYVLLRAGFPPVVIKTDDKRSYLTALNRADSGDLDSFISYIGKMSLWSLNMSLKAVLGQDIGELGDVEKEIELWNKGLRSKKVQPKSWSSLSQSIDSAGKAIQSLTKKIESKFGHLSEIKVEILMFSGFHDANRKESNVNLRNLGVYFDRFYEMLKLQDKKIRSSKIDVNLLDIVNSITLVYVFEGFSNKGGDVLVYRLPVHISFDKFTYSFATQPEVVLEKRYSDPWLETDTSLLSEYCLANIFQAFRSHEKS